ncbi:hypothetical protein Afil01_68420 [Actinorhabdospora filicis]|uniref:Uncharacterized protein n=2 Tax=Actinorhabdospora filicis TaxID=1785913 RepID=A0A9W6SU82_9ACTN|nr:hypothetical protein Afil01_68420 [Actinorhabdospora filicis]
METGLAGRAREVTWVNGPGGARGLLRRITRGRLGRSRPFERVTLPGAPWQDAPSPNLYGWRERAANEDGQTRFAVDYLVCGECALGWLEEPFRHQSHEGTGLAAACLAALGADHPGRTWHALPGGRMDAAGYWDVTEAPLCAHLRAIALAGRVPEPPRRGR